jgi:formiminotetrahydrofolate cyclodeaminase
MINTQSIESYLNALASDQPIPGGGAAAALTGAQGIALLCMVCRLTLKKPPTKYTPNFERILGTLEGLREHCLYVAQEDMDVFQQVILAYNLPKSTKKLITARNAAIQSALKAATKPPSNLILICNSVLQLIEAIYPLCDLMVRSDITVAEHLINASLRSSKTNIEANLKSITDQEFCKEKQDVINNILL